MDTFTLQRVVDLGCQRGDRTPWSKKSADLSALGARGGWPLDLSETEGIEALNNAVERDLHQSVI